MFPVRSARALRARSGVAVPVKGADPALMTPKARTAELGAILAIAFRRHLLSRQNSLAGSAHLEAQCEQEQ